jgi:beta-glucosidase
MRLRALLTIAVLAVAAGPAAAAAGAQDPPYKDPSLSAKKRVDDLLSRMTLEEKVGQMTQTERYQVFDDATPITTW